MCGISGWVLREGRQGSPEELRRLSETIRHRGPDDHGSYLDERAGLGLAHNRLSIIDLSSAGHQPMLTDDGRFALVYNGEIYNYRELREELESQGHSFRSTCDTEVVLCGFAQWGDGCLDRLHGMFALAVWFADEQRLLLARDPLGMKPLYYTETSRGFVFASELKAFLALEEFQPRIHPSGLQQFLEFGYIFQPEETALSGVHKLPPGHKLEIRQRCAGQPLAYFVPPQPVRGIPLELRQERLHDLLSRVVEQHLNADVPLGLLLSGGVDSSVIAALAARHGGLTTMTMAFADSVIDEREQARAVSRHIGSDHHEVVITARDLREHLSADVWWFDDLFSDWGLISTRMLYAKCRERGLKVVLVGEGADELLGGYGWFETSARPRVLSLLRLYRGYIGRRYGSLLLPFFRLMRDYLRQGEGDLFQAIRLFESRNQLPNNYVMKVDKASMSVGVEARAPFLDRRIAEFFYETPAEALRAEGTNKYLLRSMAQRYGLLPRAVAQRPKYGASMAMSWLDEDPSFRAWARDVVLDKEGWTDRLGLRRPMEAFFLHGRSGDPFPRPLSIFRELAWRLLQLSLWSRLYLRAGTSTSFRPHPGGGSS